MMTYHSEDEQMRVQLEQVEHEVREEQPTPVQFITGSAGTGKTYEIIRRVQEDSSYGVLASTTGISAVNLGAVTLNSLLKYFDTESMRDAFLSGQLIRVLHALALEYSWLIVDEVSMMDAEQLDILYRAVGEANRYSDVERPMGILLVGDFAQLPPVKARWAFEANCWPQFEANETILTKMWRQVDLGFLEALRAVRLGDGARAAERISYLKPSGGPLTWNSQLDTEFEGTTILPVNSQVSRFNQIALDRVPGKTFKVTSRRWGKQRSEWGENRRTHEWGIKPQAEFKIGAYVMIKANLSDGLGGFVYVNGDCGNIEGFEDNFFLVRLVRNNAVVEIHRCVRGVEQKDKPEPWSGVAIGKNDDAGGYIAREHFRGKARRYVLGQVEYFPVDLAYASSVHKSQSLTLDRVQVDFRHQFFGEAAMLYVALSRCRTLEGLRLVGQPQVFAQRCKVDERVRRWLWKI